MGHWTPGLTILTLSSPTESYTVDSLIPRLLNLTELYTIDFPGSLECRGHIMGLSQTPELSKPIPTINLLTGKDPDAGKYRKQEKGTTEVEMAGWHHLLNAHEFE